jgi:hypothetical protein
MAKREISLTKHYTELTTWYIYSRTIYTVLQRIYFHHFYIYPIDLVIKDTTDTDMCPSYFLLATVLYQGNKDGNTGSGK